MMWAQNNPTRAEQLEQDGRWHSERGHRCYGLARQHLYDLQRGYYESAQSLEDDVEVYIDLHALHPDEALEYIEPILMKQAQLGRRLIYIITGTSYSKNHKDKVAKAVKTWLNSWQYVFREFSLNGENKCYSAVGVFGVDPMSYEKNDVNGASGFTPATSTGTSAKADAAGPTGATTPGKIQLLKREADKEADQKQP